MTTGSSLPPPLSNPETTKPLPAPQSKVRVVMAHSQNIHRDVHTALEEVENMANAQLVRMHERLIARLRFQDNAINELTNRITELEGVVADKPDDKYSLSKAKLIRLMKDLGYTS